MDGIILILGLFTLATFFFAAHRIYQIYVLMRKFSETQIASQTTILQAQTELLKEARKQNRLSAQLLRAYGHEPDNGGTD